MSAVPLFRLLLSGELLSIYLFSGEFYPESGSVN